MRALTNREIVFRFVAIGFAFGLLFPLTAILIDIYLNNLSLSLRSIAQVHGSNRIIWIINSAPLAIALVAYLLGKNFASKSQQISQTAQKEMDKAHKIFEFTEKLGQGQIDVEYSFSEKDQEQDAIGRSLVKLRDYLQKSQQEELQRRQEEQQQNWTTQGLAKFGDILRQNNDNLQELSYNIISNLVNYIDARQGGFFLINDNDPADKHLEMISCYAYSRKKFLQKRIEWEEGLIGACALEGGTIYLKDIPDEHVTITSGLGETKPRNLILVPLKVNDQIHGVIELASLNILEPYQIEFLEKLAESIASVISSVKINLRTAQLLRESQEQGAKMTAQEDEMRRNMEELSHAKEEAAKQGELLANFTNAVNHTLVRAEYDTRGILLYANTRFLNKLGYTSNQEVEGKHISIFINEKDKEWFFKIWENLARGGRHFEGDMKHVTKQGKDFWSMATYTCVRNADGSIEKILFLGIDITEQKKINLDYEGQIQALNHSSIKVEFSPQGAILDANPKFLDISDSSLTSLKKKTVFDFMDDAQTHTSSFKKTWNEIIEGKPFESQFHLTDSHKNERWIEGNFTAVMDMYGQVAKVLFLASDITQRKRIEIENEQQTAQLKQQEEQLLKQQEEIKRQHEEFRKKTEQNIREIEAVKIRNEQTLEGAMDAIVSINQDETIELFNKAAEELWGLSRKEVLGKHVKAILPPPYNTLAEGEVIRYLKSSNNTLLGNRTEVSIVNQQGEEVPVLLTLTGVNTDNQSVYTAFIQNISVELF